MARSSMFGLGTGAPPKRGEAMLKPPRNASGTAQKKLGRTAAASARAPIWVIAEPSPSGSAARAESCTGKLESTSTGIRISNSSVCDSPGPNAIEPGTGATCQR